MINIEDLPEKNNSKKMSLFEKIGWTANYYRGDIRELTIKIEKLKSKRKVKQEMLENLEIILQEETEIQ